MASCTGVLTSDLLARWAQKGGGRERGKGIYSSLDEVLLELEDALKPVSHTVFLLMQSLCR